jgi:hypothetical protein
LWEEKKKEKERKKEKGNRKMRKTDTRGTVLGKTEMSKGNLINSSYIGYAL